MSAREIKTILYPFLILTLLSGLLLSVACNSVPELKKPWGSIIGEGGYYQSAPNEEPKDINGKPNTYFLSEIPGPQEGWPEGYQKFILFVEVENIGFDGICTFNINVEGDIRGDKTIAKSVSLRANTGIEFVLWWFVKGNVSYKVQPVNLIGTP